ncbi:MAG: NAD-dependent epimerase/dehydratase family protein, partial [Rhodospirillaceae bacterium]
TILVTGTSGYLGSRLAAHLKVQGHAVPDVPGRTAFAALDSTLDLIWERSRPDAVIHAAFDVDFAPRPPKGSPDSLSVANTRALLDALAQRGAPPLVFLSAAGIFGVWETDRIRDESAPGACDPAFTGYMDSRYIADKLACEALMAGYPGLATTLYLTTVYGPGMQAQVLGPLRKLKGPNPIVPAPPGMTSFLALSDLLDAVDRVLAQKQAGRFILSSGNIPYASLLHSACTVQGVAGRKTVRVLPKAARALLAGPLGKKLLGAHDAAVAVSAFGHKIYSIHAARQALGWFPKASLEDALRDALDPEQEPEPKQERQP